MATLPDYLAVKRDRLTTLRAALADGTVGPVPLSVTARLAGGSGVRPVSVRQFTIVTDSGPALAGHDLGPTAPELLLSALASCLAHSYVSVAATRGVALTTLEVEVSGQIDFRGMLGVDPAAPVPPHAIAYTARAATAAEADALADLREEVERCCPVLQALRCPTPVSGAIETSEA